MYSIEVKNVNKKFKIPHEKKTTVFERLVGLVSKKNGYEEFHALKNISFSVRRGESVGIIGDNGSGKTTLLSILANVLRPDNGVIKLNGRITPFLELGIGFNPEMTAIENILVYGMIMGLSKKEINQKMDDILNFAGLMNFKDAKFKNYSSGMQVRLAFSTAIQTQPDILLVDELLAVGDMEFQQKCFDVFNNFKKNGVTLILVSHDLGAIRRYCEKTLLLNKGEQVAFGLTDKIIDKYIYRIPDVAVKPTIISQRVDVEQTKIVEPNKIVKITNVKLFDKFGNEQSNFISGDEMKIRIWYETAKKLENPVFGIGFYSEKDIFCYGTNTELKKQLIQSIDGRSYIDFDIARISMLQGRFFINVSIRDKNHVMHDRLVKKFKFNVIKKSQDDGMFDISCTWGYKKELN